MHVQSNGGWLGGWLGGRLGGWLAGRPNPPPPPAGWHSSFGSGHTVLCTSPGLRLFLLKPCLRKMRFIAFWPVAAACSPVRSRGHFDVAPGHGHVN